MHDQVPTSEPTEAIAGLTLRWDRSLAHYPPADGWTLRYALRGPVDKDFDATAVAGVYQVRPSLTDLEALTPGAYRLVGYVEKGDPEVTERHAVYDGTLLVLPDPTDAVNAQSHAQRTLAVIEAALEGRLAKDQESFQVNGRAVHRIPIGELRKLRVEYAWEVWREQHPGQFGPSAAVRFGAPA